VVAPGEAVAALTVVDAEEVRGHSGVAG
jgi:hypothetical protein